MSRKIKLWVSLFCICLAAMLLVSETMVRLIAPQYLNGTWLVKTPGGLTVNRDSGSAQQQHEERSVRYRFGQFHTRARHMADGERVVVLGDSFTFGMLLEEEDTYVSLLQQRIDNEFGAGRFALLNAATGGWGAADYTAYLEDFGDQIQPSAVIVFISIDDFRRAGISQLYRGPDQDFELVRRTPQGGEPGLREFVRSFAIYQFLLENSHLFQFLRNFWVGHLALGHNNPEAETQSNVPGPDSKGAPVSAPANAGDHREVLARAYFRKIRNWSQARGIKLLVMTNGFPRPLLRNLSHVMQEEGVPFHDLVRDMEPIVRSDPDRYLIPGDGHPTEEGAALVAEHAWPFVREFLETLASNRIETGKTN